MVSRGESRETRCPGILELRLGASFPSTPAPSQAASRQCIARGQSTLPERIGVPQQ